MAWGVREELGMDGFQPSFLPRVLRKQHGTLGQSVA